MNADPDLGRDSSGSHPAGTAASDNAQRTRKNPAGGNPEDPPTGCAGRWSPRLFSLRRAAPATDDRFLQPLGDGDRPSTDRNEEVRKPSLPAVPTVVVDATPIGRGFASSVNPPLHPSAISQKFGQGDLAFSAFWADHGILPALLRRFNLLGVGSPAWKYPRSPNRRSCQSSW